MDLNHLNLAQQTAVLETDGPMMILAGAGSGKTRTLIARIQYLLEEKRLSPYQILAVTFSNKAAREMRERLAQVTEYDIGTFQITTFHSFCARLLRMEAQALGLSKNFTIFDDSESQALAKNVLSRLGINLKEITPNTLCWYVDQVKNLGYFPGSGLEIEAQNLTDDHRLWNLFQEYESELHRNNAVDFGGLITGVLQLFAHFPDVKQKYQKRFRYLLVDEFQDTNRAQFHLINLLSDLHKNICVVGDEDQSIYSWRGADIRNILDFEKKFPETKILKLEQNYRSSKKIIQAAAYVINRNAERKGKNLWTDNPEGENLTIYECRDDREEATVIADEIKKLLKNNTKPSEVALIYRNNSQSRSLEDALRRERIHYHVVAGIKFYDRKEIKDMLSYMRVVVNPKDSLAFSRVINIPARGVGPSTLRKFEDEAVSKKMSLYEIVKDVVTQKESYKHLTIGPKIQSALSQFVFLIEEVRAMEDAGELAHVSLEKLLHDSGYFDTLKADKTVEGAARLENLQELSNALIQFQETGEAPYLSQFLETITLDTTPEEERKESVALMTAHGSKGLEYPYIFLTGMEETIFPSFKSIEIGGRALEEERRLFYVAMTRAMQKLTITFAQARLMWGNLKFNGPSQFLHELPKECFDWVILSPHQKNKSSLNNQGSDEWFNQDISDYSEKVFRQERVYQSTKIAQSLSVYPKGTRIHHSIYGDGVVVESEGTGADEKILIQFRDSIRKRFMVKFAPLKKIEQSSVV
jgi:DNA helicase-2/ATP-dependent DNA helicase PcrA